MEGRILICQCQSLLSLLRSLSSRFLISLQMHPIFYSSNCLFRNLFFGSRLLIRSLLFNSLLPLIALRSHLAFNSHQLWLSQDRPPVLQFFDQKGNLPAAMRVQEHPMAMLQVAQVVLYHGKASYLKLQGCDRVAGVSRPLTFS